MQAHLTKKIYVAGHRGMVGSAIVRNLQNRGYTNIVCRTRTELDLINQSAVAEFFKAEKPDQVYLAAARVGGIHANNAYPAEFIYENLMVQNNVIHQAFISGVKKLLFLGSSCIYPRLAPQPMGEDALLTGKLEPTNEPYAIAKIAGIKLCESYNRQYGHLHGIDYRSVMPTNLYGPGDNYDTVNCHVIPALIKRFHEAKVNNLEMVEIWGTGTARREFLHVDDMAAASVFVMELDKKILDTQTTPMQSHINIGFGEDITIYKLSHLISKVIGYKGNICFDSSKPDGPPRKNLNSTCIQSLGWRPTIEFEEGLRLTYLAYCKQLV